MTALRDIAPLIAQLARRKSLSAGEVDQIVRVTSEEDEVGYFYLAFAMGLMAKGPTTEELLGIVQALQQFAVRVPTDIAPQDIIDVSGSGGDLLKTFNVSTASALVVATAGLRVAKQSFRAFTSYSGSSDVLRDVGVMLPTEPAGVARLLAEIGIAPIDFSVFYTGMEPRLKAVAKLREIGLTFPTPMHPVALIPSPISMRRRVYGLFSPEFLRPAAEIFKSLNYEHVLVCHGRDGLDEVSTIGSTAVVELHGTEIREYDLAPSDLGLPTYTASEISVASREESTEAFISVLKGEASQAKSDLVAANAGAALYVGGRSASIREGVGLAREIVASGRAYDKLQQLVAASAGVKSKK